jgi:lipoyl(octanoyl) transferase
LKGTDPRPRNSEREVLDWAWLGRVRFAPAAALQERIRAQVLAGRSPGAVLFCEHDPVITLGRGARSEHVLAGDDELRRRGIEVVHASRGGDVTFHGPGQLIGYPIMRLRHGVVAHVEAMARAVIEVLGQFGVAAEWRRACPGVWVGTEKVCAFGVHVRHGVAIHGFALNVSTDLSSFATIVPCGLRATGVTSLARLTGRESPALDVLAGAVAAACVRTFALPLRQVSTGALEQTFAGTSDSGGFSIAKGENRSLE